MGNSPSLVGHVNNDILFVNKLIYKAEEQKLASWTFKKH
jgi:hypothetical protein